MAPFRNFSVAWCALSILSLNLVSFCAENNHTAPPSQAAPASHASAPEAEAKTKPLENDLMIGKSPRDNLILKANSEYEQRQNAEGIKKLQKSRELQANSKTLEAAQLLKEVFLSDTTPGIKMDTMRLALLQLADYAEEEGNLEQALQLRAEYVRRFDQDSIIPEVLLRQAYLYQKMGAYDLAISKLYGVLTAAAALKSGNLAYSQRVTLTAQTEIAETHYSRGEYDKAAQMYERLLSNANEELNVVVVKTKLIRALSKIEGKTDEVVRHAVNFLNAHAQSDQQAEVRYLLATAYKALNQKQESLRQFLLLLEAVEVSGETKWKTWKMLAGNEIGNQLFLEGDNTNAVIVYKGLLGLDDALSWKLPIHYQIGLCFERLAQPEEAIKTYSEIMGLGQKTATKLEPSLQIIVDMARFRSDILSWKKRLESLDMPADPKVAEKTP